MVLKHLFQFWLPPALLLLLAALASYQRLYRKGFCIPALLSIFNWKGCAENCLWWSSDMCFVSLGGEGRGDTGLLFFLRLAMGVLTYLAPDSCVCTQDKRRIHCLTPFYLEKHPAYPTSVLLPFLHSLICIFISPFHRHILNYLFKHYGHSKIISSWVLLP